MENIKIKQSTTKILFLHIRIQITDTSSFQIALFPLFH